MTTKNIIAHAGIASATLVFGVAMLTPVAAFADVNSGNYGSGFDILDSYDTQDYVEPTYVTYSEPGSVTYYEPKDTSYYEPKNYSYYEPKEYSYYEPSSYSYNYPTYDYDYGNYSSYTPPSYSYDYSYDYVYDYSYQSDYDQCSNLPGLQPQGYKCYKEVDHDDEDLTCDLSVDDRTVEEGDEVTLEWDIDGNANYASINQGVGRVDEDGGEEEVEVDEDTTFKLTVRNSHGDEDTCSVTVRVDEEDNTFSSVDFEGEPTNNPPQVVYLSSIPYTGLEDIDPTLLSYWLMLIAGAGIAAWYMFRNGLLPSFAFASGEPTVGEETVEEAPVGDAPATENSFVTALTHNDVEGAVDQIRTAAAHGTSVEDFLEEAATAAQGTALESRINAALEASRQNGIRGAKAVLTA